MFEMSYDCIRDKINMFCDHFYYLVPVRKGTRNQDLAREFDSELEKYTGVLHEVLDQKF